MIHRPNVRARIYTPNLQTKSSDNRKFWKRNFKLYTKSCKWCRRPTYWSAFDYPGFCSACGSYLNGLEGLPIHVRSAVDHQDWLQGEDIPF